MIIRGHGDEATGLLGAAHLGTFAWTRALSIFEGGRLKPPWWIIGALLAIAMAGQAVTEIADIDLGPDGVGPLDELFANVTLGILYIVLAVSLPAVALLMSLESAVRPGHAVVELPRQPDRGFRADRFVHGDSRVERRGLGSGPRRLPEPARPIVDHRAGDGSRLTTW